MTEVGMRFASFVVGMLLWNARTPALAVEPNELLDQVARGELTLFELIDPARGLARIGQRLPPAGDYRLDSELRCGQTLARSLRMLEGHIWDWLRDTREAHGRIACGPMYDRVACDLGATEKWDPAFHFIFEDVAGRGPTLVAIVSDEEAMFAPWAIKATHRQIEPIVRDLMARGCPETSFALDDVLMAADRARKRGELRRATRYYHQALALDPTSKRATEGLRKTERAQKVRKPSLKSEKTKPLPQ